MPGYAKDYVDPNGAFALHLPDDWQATRTAQGDSGWLTQFNSGTSQSESAATALQNAAGIYYERDNLAETTRYVQQARQLFAAAQYMPGVVSTTEFLVGLAREANDLALLHFACAILTWNKSLFG